MEYNYRREPAEKPDRALKGREKPEESGPVSNIAAMCGTDSATFMRERPGMSAFVLEDGVVYHTYSAFSRGLDGMWGMYQWLDRAPKGRNETDLWFRRRDEYGKGPQKGGSCCEG